MVSSGMSNKKLILLCSGVVVIIVLALVIMVLYNNGGDRFADANYDPDSIAKIQVKVAKANRVYSSNQFTVEHPDNIEKVIGYVKKMSETILKTDGVSFQPVNYEFVYYFKSGKSKVFVHEFLSVTSDGGFENIFRLEEVIPQVHHIFTTKRDEIREVTLFAWTDDNSTEPIMYDITDGSIIDYIIEVGQENMLMDIDEAQKLSKYGIQFTGYKHDDPLFIIPIHPDMYMFEELCERVPKVKEFVELIDTE